MEVPNTVVVEKVNDPKIEEETDAILRLTTAAICGSDLHMYEGRAPIEPGRGYFYGFGRFDDAGTVPSRMASALSSRGAAQPRLVDR